MSDPSGTQLDHEHAVDELCDRFELAWRDGHQPSLTDFLNQAPDQLRLRVLAELWAIELHHRRDEQGCALNDAQLSRLHPELAGMLDELPTLDGAGAAPVSWRLKSPPTFRATLPSGHASDARPAPTDSRGLHIRCPHCSNAVELLADAAVEDVECHSCGSQFSLVDSDDNNDEARVLETVGRFELLSRLGVGGFGTVWKARDTELDRVVALKIPRKGRLSTRETEQFLREARSAAQLRHPNIVPVFEIGRGEGSLFIVSEFVRGVTLSKWLDLGERTYRDTAELCATLADALHAAHAEGVVHRDLKPANVMLDLAGRPRLMDFGLAKRDAGEITMTMDGQVLGTPAYMSPEQARGHGHWTDRRTDIYSLGVMLFEMLTGELPFRGSAAMQFQKRLSAEPPSPCNLNRAIPVDLSTICLKCLEQDPNRRYQAAAEVAAELRRWLSGEPIYARPLSRFGYAARWSRRRPATAAALALGAVLAVAGPTAAVVINLQSSALTNRLAERDALILSNQQEKADLQEQLVQLREELHYLTGGDPERPIEPWRVGLIRSLLGKRQTRYEEQLAAMPVSKDKALLLVSLARLLHAAGEYEQAIAHWQAALDTGALSTGQTSRLRLRLAGALIDRRSLDAAREVLQAIQTPSELSGRVDSIGAGLLNAAAERNPNRKQAALRAAAVSKQDLETAWPSEAERLDELADALLAE